MIKVKEVKLKQGSADWLDWRQQGIGGSDIPVILGVSPYKNILELYNEKISGKRPPVGKGAKMVMEKGHRYEEIAREEVEELLFTTLEPKLFQGVDEPSKKVSLDGYYHDTDNDVIGIWECKYVGRDVWTEFMDASREPYKRIPPKYLPQLLFQAYMTGASKMILTCVIDNVVDNSIPKGEIKSHTINVEVDDRVREDIKTMMVEVDAFIKCIKTKTPPVDKNESPIKDVDDEKLAGLLSDYFSVKYKVDKYTKEMKSVADEVYKLARVFGDNIMIKNYKVTHKKGGIVTIVEDAKRYIKENNIDLVKLGYTRESKSRASKSITIVEGK